MALTRDEAIAQLAALEATLADRVEVWRVIVAGGHDGEPLREVCRIYEGSFIAPRGSQHGEPQRSGGEKT